MESDLITYQSEYIKLLERECENQARILLTKLNYKTSPDVVKLGEKFRKMIAEAKDDKQYVVSNAIK